MSIPLQAVIVVLLGALWCMPAAAAPVEDSLAQRVVACRACHGDQGRATPSGFYPRIAGKPAGYLYNQLLNFRDGRRRNEAMRHMLEYLSDDYLREIADYFAGLHPPYPPPAAPVMPPEALARGRLLVMEGDAAQKLPACSACHGQELLGVAPAIPGLVGLPRDYLAAQLGAWQSGTRHAMAPDCMAALARRLQPEDVAAVTAWLASQAVTASAPQTSRDHPLPLDCGGVP